MGGGTFVPTKSIGEDEPLAVEYFNFSSSIADHLTSASLVIGHADLMDNHQSELAEELVERKHSYCARLQDLHQVIAGMDLESLLPYHPGS
ncbi:UDP-N-acetylglucosamine transferase subunit ALG13 homolog isoform X3 [Mangifera indica]|uniref:UDP-N-acetylglucosamine transferase subunit ALG13 homolog isoform X3 n=1 Tax=Mangifera indica TaxID=29780 RepID=UPI001CF95C9E|nr:UDP-N-acetylglucosamine transferase subunit ALG13 homolog isoform X3 [Mangifera indica]